MLDNNVVDGKGTSAESVSTVQIAVAHARMKLLRCHHTSNFRQRPPGASGAKNDGKTSAFVDGTLPRLHRVVPSADVVQLHTVRSASKDRCTVHWATLVRGIATHA